MKTFPLIAFTALLLLAITSCQPDESLDGGDTVDEIIDNDTGTQLSAIERVFGDRIDPNALDNYEGQSIPNYIEEDNTNGNQIENEMATLGRVLFYDVNLSVDNTISCASCHQQAFAFGDPERLSQGVDGLTGRHSMRLVNARFAEEDNFFWDERASSLEEQTTMPIQDHIEMGFSGQNGDPSIDDLIAKLSEIDYYNELFTLAYGDELITENRMQLALAQFVRSIQSFDSKYDVGRSQVMNNNLPYPNFTPQENLGKQLFMQDIQFFGNSSLRSGGGFACQSCHRAPEFDISENSRNNGVINTASDPDERDLTVTRSPSLRDLFDQNGNLNGPMMHTGDFQTMEMVLDHYNDMRMHLNTNLDPRLRRGDGVQLNMTDEERDAVIAFLKTLSGSDMYTNEKWSDPF